MIELVWLPLATLVHALRSHQRLLFESLLLRQRWRLFAPEFDHSCLERETGVSRAGGTYSTVEVRFRMVG